MVGQSCCAVETWARQLAKTDEARAGSWPAHLFLPAVSLHNPQKNAASSTLRATCCFCSYVSQKTIAVAVWNINQRADLWPSAGSSCTHCCWTPCEAFCKRSPLPGHSFPIPFSELLWKCLFLSSNLPIHLAWNDHCPMNILSEHVCRCSWFLRRALSNVLRQGLWCLCSL